MAENREKGNPLGTVRRTIWFIIRTVLIVSVLLGLGYAVFTEAMYISNMYVIVTEGMELRADTVLNNGSASDLVQYFTEDFLNNDMVLYVRPYSDYMIDNYDYRYSIRSFSVLPWASSGSVGYEERIPTINGSPASDGVPSSVPDWLPRRYNVHLVKVDGRWLIDRLDVLEEEAEQEPLPTADVSQIEVG